MTEAEFAEARVDDDLLHSECPFFHDDHRIEGFFAWGPFTASTRCPCSPHNFQTNEHTGDWPR
jgi:hypothetical protein